MDKYYFSATQALRKGRQLHMAERQNLYETLSVVLIAFWFVALGLGVSWYGWINFLLLGAFVVALLQLRKQPSRIQQ